MLQKQTPTREMHITTCLIMMLGKSSLKRVLGQQRKYLMKNTF